MPTKTVDIQTSQLSLQELVSLMDDNAEIILTTGDKPVARLSPLEKQPEERIPNLHHGVWMSDPIDEPLPDEFWSGNDEFWLGEDKL